MVTQVLDGADCDAGCMRTELTSLGTDEHVARFVDHLALAVTNARVREVNIVRTMR
jgi:hypothetical protein